MFAVVFLFPSGMLRLLRTLAAAEKNDESSVAQLPSLLQVPFVSSWYVQPSESDSFLSMATCMSDVFEESVHAMLHGCDMSLQMLTRIC